MYLEDQRDAVPISIYLFYCQVTLHVSGVSRIHHQEYTNEQLPHFGHGQSEVAARPWTLFNRILSLHLHNHDLYQWL